MAHPEHVLQLVTIHVTVLGGYDVKHCGPFSKLALKSHRETQSDFDEVMETAQMNAIVRNGY